jgi:hypothetical protein
LEEKVAASVKKIEIMAIGIRSAEAQEITLRLTRKLSPDWHGWLYQQLTLPPA